jgi:hypothetical protein
MDSENQLPDVLRAAYSGELKVERRRRLRALDAKI